MQNILSYTANMILVNVHTAEIQAISTYIASCFRLCKCCHIFRNLVAISLIPTTYKQSMHSVLVLMIPDEIR